jgi:hypothetical protein
MLLAVPPALPEFPPLHFKPAKPVRYVLDNGLIVYLLEDHELPLVRLDLFIKAGTQYDPVDKIGRRRSRKHSTGKPLPSVSPSNWKTDRGR